MGILEVKGVSKHFGGLLALDDVNLSIQQNTVHAIIGPNGAGKSTLLNCFIGKLLPDTGTVMFNNKSLLGLAPYQINQAGISRVFQTPEVFSELSILENVMIPAFAHRDGAFHLSPFKSLARETSIREQAEKILQDVGLIDERHHTASAMSRGNKRRLEMAMCLVQQPKLLLLDEPTAGMSRSDTNNTIDLLKTINEAHNITFVVIEHDMHVVFSLADRISVLSQGHVIVEDYPDKIKGHPEVQEAYLGTAESE
ncbi:MULTISPECIES: ABC transporter ATP-binding protein [Marinobacter]|uniref:ABC transporter ATP-binding protein n=1 Tax=Marinobacter suaedae TaxID=3057675 RepID=A0ABT8VXA4_9GAMM|nr:MULTISPECIES: ABC transporter ATP-binding protein [unclassified Marinobacter]MBZ2168751.1 ABC transporter ATP-binding protein [Marinobacter sp. F4216]MDO3720628.1 ABC transporter ATP-binding protein [Marinobacter sp. chi1]